MKHPRSRLPEYADRALPEPERRRVEEHLESCPECRSELEGLSRVSGLLAGLPKRPLPPGFLARLQARRLREGSEAPSFRLPGRARAAALALAGALAAFVVFDRAQVLLAPDDWPRGADSSFDEGASPELRSRTKDEDRKEDAALQDEALRPGLGLKLAKARGAPMDAAPAAPAAEAARGAGPAMTNEVLHQKLESEKKRMGIRKIVPPQPANALEAQFARLRGAGGGQAERLVGAPSPALVSGPTPKLLAADPFAAPAGEPVLPAAPPVPAPEALVLPARDALLKAWAERGLPGAPPAADFERQRVLLLLPPAKGLAVEVVSVRERAHRVIVSWRLVGASAGAPAHAVELLPKGDKPIALEPAP